MRCASTAASMGEQFAWTDCISARAWSGWPSLIAARMAGATERAASADGQGSGQMRVETVSRQDRLRFFCSLALAHAASGRVEQVLARIKSLLAGEELVAKETVAARLVTVTDSALTLEVLAMFDTIDGGKFLDAKERLLLGLLRILEEEGVAIAPPARSVELSFAAALPATPEQRDRPGSAPRLSKTG